MTADAKELLEIVERDWKDRVYQFAQVVFNYSQALHTEGIDFEESKDVTRLIKKLAADAANLEYEIQKGADHA